MSWIPKRKEMDKQARVARGEMAGHVIDALSEAFDAIYKTHTRAILDSKAGDADKREESYRAYQAAREAHNHLLSIVRDGKLAADELKQTSQPH